MAKYSYQQLKSKYTGFIDGCAEIDIEALQAFRRKFPVERDADKFEILIEKE